MPLQKILLVDPAGGATRPVGAPGITTEKISLRDNARSIRRCMPSSVEMASDSFSRDGPLYSEWERCDRYCSTKSTPTKSLNAPISCLVIGPGTTPSFTTVPLTECTGHIHKLVDVRNASSAV